MKLPITLFALLLVASLALASLDCTQVTISGTSLEDTKIALPSAVGQFFEGETTNLHVLLNDNSTVIVGGKVEKGFLHDLTCGGFSNPSMDAYIDQTTLESIDASSNPTKAFLEAKAAGKIKLSGNGLVSGIKVTIANVLAGLANFFS